MKFVMCLPKNVFESEAIKNFVSVCHSKELESIYMDSSSEEVRGAYSSILYENKNVVTWIFRIPHSSYKGINTLFLDNGLLFQKNGIFLDHLGHWTDSSFVLGNKASAKYSKEEYSTLCKYMLDNFGFDKRDDFDKDGPILIALQTKSDCPTQFYFKHPLYNYEVLVPSFTLGMKLEKRTIKSVSEDSVYNLLHICKDKFPENVPVIVRPHPLDRERFKSQFSLYAEFFKGNWSIDESPKIYDTAKKCRVIVTINSTVATEMLFIGIPVVVLGKGLFTNSGAVFDCSEDFEKLKYFPDYVPDVERINSFLCSILRYQVPYNASCEFIENHPSVKAWIGKTL